MDECESTITAFIRPWQCMKPSGHGGDHQYVSFSGFSLSWPATAGAALTMDEETKR